MSDPICADCGAIARPAELGVTGRCGTCRKAPSAVERAMHMPARTPQRQWLQQEIRKAKHLRQMGASYDAIGRDLGRSGRAVQHALRRAAGVRRG